MGRIALECARARRGRIARRARAMPRGGASRVAVLALIALATSAAPRRATADRARLPRDARDERLDDDDARLRAEEHVAYASDARSRVGLRRDGTDARQWIERISESPRAYVYRNFLTREEAEATIAAARRTMRRSEVVNEADGTSKTSDERTSSGGWVSGEDSEVMANIERRVAAWTMLPRNRGETTQVMRYEAGQEYAAHDDYFHDEVNVKNGGQRAATVLMYLSDVEEGGETVFPRGTPLGGAAPEKSGVTQGNACERALRGDPNVLAVKPRRGDALLFFNVHLNGEVDERARHAGCPVVRGTKWTATRWQHVGALNIGSFARTDSQTT